MTRASTCRHPSPWLTWPPSRPRSPTRSSRAGGGLRATAFIGGPAVAEFEQEYAAFLGVGHCVGVANGTDALELALRAAASAGGEVILPANTFIATAEAVSRIGAVPVLVDVDPEYLLIDPDRVARRSRPGPRPSCRCTCSARPPGRALGTDRGSRGAVIVEDAAQSQGAPATAGPPARSGWSPAPASTRARTSAPPATPAP